MAGCATYLKTAGNSIKDRDPAGEDVTMEGFVSTQWPPYRAKDTLSITGARGDAGEYATPDRAGELVKDKYSLTSHKSITPP